MAYRSRAAPRIGLAALALILCTACSVFESQESEFPDAGPNGPDSLYAGIGRGIPFGEAGLSLEQFRSPITGAQLPVSRSNVGAVLKAARAGKLRLVLNLAGSGDHYRNPDGTFNLDPYPGKCPLGRWTISKDRLTIIFITDFGEDPNPEVDRIVKLTETDLVIEVVSERKDRGARYSYKRVRTV